METLGQGTGADKHHPQQYPHHHQGLPGMAGLWCLKYRHPIGNRLHPGHGGTARGKGLQYQQQAQTFRSPNRIHRRRRRCPPLQ